MNESFPELRLQGKLRPSQAEVIDIARKKIAEGKRQLHIVAPPGSGKTVLGLFLWAECVKQPALVLSPNSAIQSQWATKVELFQGSGDARRLVSTNPKSPAMLTSLTYQAMTMPRRGDESLDQIANELWVESLLEKGHAQTYEEAIHWIEDLQARNPGYHEQRISEYRKQSRDQAARKGQSLEVLHASSMATWERLRDYGLGLVIFDECHHLMGHWGRVIAGAHEHIGSPLLVGLTATPPDREGQHPDDVKRYDRFFGEIDYEVPVPAVVKDGFLAPYQDLVYFVRPSANELRFVAQADDELHRIVEDLNADRRAPVVPAQPVSSSPTNDKDAPAASATSTASVTALPSANAVPSASPSSAAPSSAAPSSAAPSSAAPSSAAPPSATPPAATRSTPTELDDSVGGLSLRAWLRLVLSSRHLPTGQARDWGTFERRDPAFAHAARVYLLQLDERLPEDVPAPVLHCPLEQIPKLSVIVPILDRYIRHYLRRSVDGDDQRLAERAIRQLRLLGIQITETGCQACASPVGRVMAYSRSKLTALEPILKAETAALGESLRAVVVADFEKSSATSAEIADLLDAEAGGAVAAFKALLASKIGDALNPILVTGSSVLVDDDLAELFDREASAWLAKSGSDVKLEFGHAEGFHVINGIGPDWCPRVYVAMITELFQRGVTRCLVGTRGLLGEGWDANKVNVLIDLTTVTTSMTVNQLRGRSIRLDPDQPKKVADNWDVICIAPEFTKGLDDYKRFLAKHEKLFGVTEDGAIEKGAGHVHPAFGDLQPEGVEDNVDRLNADMLSRVAQREPARERWKIGQPYLGQSQRTVEARVLGKRERGRGGFPPFAGAREAWSDRSLSAAIGKAVAESLFEAKLLGSRPELHLSERAGGYVRLYLEKSDMEESQLFATSMQEVLAPLDQSPRYLIPRDIVRVERTWVGERVSNVLPQWLRSRLPESIGRHLEKRIRERAMWHAVPAALAKNKELVEVFQKHWNRHVSPGKAIFGLREEGDRILEKARKEGHSSEASVHEKEVFS